MAVKRIGVVKKHHRAFALFSIGSPSTYISIKDLKKIVLKREPRKKKK
jgi:hypothetical protein